MSATRMHIARVIALLSLSGVIMHSGNAETLSQFAERMEQAGPYSAHAEYSVLLPSAPDDIVYSIDLFSVPNHADDPLKTDSYLIEWSLPTPSGESSGFNAYDHGNHYRYRDTRLQEYHYEWDSIPFNLGGGVHRAAQFADLLPDAMAKKLKEMAADTAAYKIVFIPDKKVGDNLYVTIEGSQILNGLTVKEISMTFDAATTRPIKIEYENNPGAISEQTVSVAFSESNEEMPSTFDEPMLLKRHGDIFERFRQSNFKIENLAGEQMPQFSLPTLTGERFTYHRGDKFKSPTIIAVIDPQTGTAAETVATLRDAVASLPMGVDLIFAFVSNDIDGIEAVAGNPSVGETMLTSAKSLARDCGITSFPTMIFVGRDGVISDTQLGFNKALKEIVIQKAINLK